MGKHGYKIGDKDFDRLFENSLNGIDPETLSFEDIEAQEEWLETYLEDEYESIDNDYFEEE
jgi:hypothetical protein